MDLGKTIKDLRKQKGLTQGQFAIKCDITQTYLSQIENNQRDPNLSVLKTISEKLEIPLPILFFQSMTEEDIKSDKREIFRMIGPDIKNIIDEVFSI